jgi:hypothetical protein
MKEGASELRCLRKLRSARRVLGEATCVRKVSKFDTDIRISHGKRPSIEGCDV